MTAADSCTEASDHVLGFSDLATTIGMQGWLLHSRVASLGFSEVVCATQSQPVLNYLQKLTMFTKPKPY